MGTVDTRQVVHGAIAPSGTLSEERMTGRAWGGGGKGSGRGGEGRKGRFRGFQILGLTQDCFTRFSTPVKRY